jgi:WD40-like Beta Propeller Repeat
MRRAGRAGPFLLLLASLAGCGREIPANPFRPPTRTVPLPANASLLFTSGVWSTLFGAAREVYAIAADGSAPTRLSYCTESGTSACDNLEAMPSVDRNRILVRRSRIGTDGVALVYLDLSRGVEVELVEPISRVSGADWSPRDGFLVFSAVSSAGSPPDEDLFISETTGQNPEPLTATTLVREFRPRLDAAASVVVYERLEADGKARIYLYQPQAPPPQLPHIPLSEGGPGTSPLANTRFVVGADTDPAFSPDGRRVVFRRLTDLGNGSLGVWDIMTTSRTGVDVQPLMAGGGVHRGAPDWGPLGIVFTETDVQGARIVLVQPDGTGRRVLYTQSQTAALGNVRWLR